MKITVVRNILEANDNIARENRQLLDERGIYAVNLMSSPGAGKTSLLEKTLMALRDRFRVAVIEGDIQDTLDADRIATLGIPVVQVNTQGACHMDANMTREALGALDLEHIDVLFIENVGNLVCPAEFIVGENVKVMILSTPEGADKPAKYPLMFKESAALIINKMDLLPHVDFDLDTAKKRALALNPDLSIFEVSCKTGLGIDRWVHWLTSQISSFKQHVK
ncbi:MAG TPA: hydrogenase nickel incorporation protein HypB [Syntrophales bacterium]|nr:hydrogenase nickel incorporation protein HypB [Syntrophales bacterium]HOL60008.1 hydrogenase nickel incorporation protein HypB [Syntrophales bacterium]HPO36147.1 hydrogenase nickel incorporation protein HypB [Syntrophales bacterium]